MGYSTSIRTVVKNKDRNNNGVVYMEIVFIDNDTKKKIRRYVPTNQKIKVEDYANGRIKQVKRTKLVRDIIDIKKVEVSEKLRELQISNGDVTPEIYDLSIKKNPHAGKTVMELFDSFISFNSKRRQLTTIKKFGTTKALLEEYAKSKGKSKLILPDIDQRFYNGFSEYLLDVKKHKPATVRKYQTTLKTFMGYLTEELGLNQESIQKRFKKESAKGSENRKVVLLKEHVRKLVEWQPTTKSLEVVRDLFLFQIYTGIRHSDLVNVSKSYVVNNTLSFVVYKTTDRLSIPLHSKALEILKKYKYDLGKQCISQQKYNDYIKDVCELAGLTEPVRTLNIRLDEKVPEDTPLYKLVTSHCGRTTFITNCIVAGINPAIVMSYTGHKDIKTVMGYVKLAESITVDAFKRFEEYFNF